MKNFVKLLGIIALVAVIGFSLVGCGEDDDDNNNDDNGFSWKTSVVAGGSFYASDLTGNIRISVIVSKINTSDNILTTEQRNEVETAIKKLTKNDVTVSPLVTTSGDRTLTIGEPSWTEEFNDLWPSDWESRWSLNFPVTRSDWVESRETSTITVNYPATQGFTWDISNGTILW
jgi:hypothetical protein